MPEVVKTDNGERPRLAFGTVDGIFIFEPADYIISILASD